VSRPGQIRFLSRTARLYDPIVRGMGFSGLWRRVAERAAPTPELRCLDVCTGTGGAALALADRGARVLGVDVASGMLARAGSKVRARGLAERIRLVQMDARDLAIADASFPLVTCVMALHEMAEAERSRVLAELRRVSSDRVLVADYRVPSGRGRALLFRTLRAYEYLESDDFEGYAARDVGARLTAARLRVEPPWDAGAYRIWPCRVDRS